MTDRTEEQERVPEEALEALDELAVAAIEPDRKMDENRAAGRREEVKRSLEAHLTQAKAVTRLREQKAELERAAREAREALARLDDAECTCGLDYDPCAFCNAIRDLRSALDESEGRGGGEDCDECGHPLDEHGYSGCARCGCDHDALPGLVGPTPQPGHYFESGDTTYYCPNCNAATPDPSEGEVGCDHENTVLDDNVEWCPDCRRVMPEDAEDAEDDGRGEGQAYCDGCKWRSPEHGGLSNHWPYEINPHCPVHGAESGLDVPDCVLGAPTHSDADPEARIVDTPTPDECPGVVVGWRGGKTVAHPPGADCPVHPWRTIYGSDADPESNPHAVTSEEAEGLSAQQALNRLIHKRWRSFADRVRLAERVREELGETGSDADPDDEGVLDELESDLAGGKDPDDAEAMRAVAIKAVAALRRTATEEGEGGRNAGGWDGPYPPKSSGGVNE